MATGTYYDLLGVARDATAEEIRGAYLRRAQLFHPDRHQAASDDVRREAERVMAELNEAYETLRDPSRRASYDQSFDGSAPQPEDDWSSTMRPPHEDECTLCGSWPAQPIRLQQQTGKLLWRTRRELDTTLCRNCGHAMVVDVTNRTLLTGWWGVISFFANFAVLWSNFAAWSDHKKLAPPTLPDEPMLVPMDRPAPVPSPLWQRAGVWVTAVLLFFVGSVASEELSTAPSAGASTTSTSGTSGQVTIDDFEGLCLVYDSAGEIEDVVGCWQSHDARVLEVTDHPAWCPSSSPYYWEFDEGVLCVDG